MTGWFETKNSALEAYQAMSQGGLLYKGGGYKGKYQIYVKLRFGTINIICDDFRIEFLVKFSYF